MFDDIRRFCNPKQSHSTFGYLSVMEFEQMARTSETWKNPTLRGD